jgi:hypothetical protein
VLAVSGLFISNFRTLYISFTICLILAGLPYPSMKKNIVCAALTLFVFASSIYNAIAQSTKTSNFLKRIARSDSSRRPVLIPLPVIGYAQETGFEFGASAFYSFYSDTANRNTRLSNANAFAAITTKGQSRVNLGLNYWTPGNHYHNTLTLNYINFPFNFYGIGSATNKADEEKITEKRIRVNGSIEKLLGSHVYIGMLAGAFNYDFYSPYTNGIFETDPQIQNRSGGADAFIGPSLTIDTRNNNTYTTQGFKLSGSYSFLKGLFANNNYSGGLLAFQFSQFFALAKKLTLAYDLYDNSLIGDEAPFYLMPALGSNERMRGYYNGRYRDKNYVAAQTELRYRMSKRFGVVGFGGTGTVFHDTFDVNQLKPDYGAGIRYFFDVEKGLSFRFDYGVGEKRPGELRQKGFYVGLGEAF